MARRKLGNALTNRPQCLGRSPKKKTSLRAELLEARWVLDSTVVFNEISYHPAADDTTLEYVELFNQQAVDMDLSGWSLRSGIDYTFPQGTILAGGGYLVVAASPSALQTATGYAGALGPYVGMLSNSGETLRLVNNNQRIMDEITYSDNAPWAVGPDGAGVTLAKTQADTASETPANWSSSRQVNGSPGAPNFPSGDTVQENTLVAATGTWKFLDTGVEPSASWRDAGFNDTAWSSGAGLFYDTTATLPAAKNTQLATGRNTYYFRNQFTYNGNAAQVQLYLNPIVDDGAVFYLNGVEIYRMNMAGGAVNYNTPATTSVGNAVFSGRISVPANLSQGTNVLAVEVHQAPNGAVVGPQTITPAPGFTIGWDGSDGAFYSPNNPANAPDNAARATHGVTAFGSSEYGAGTHFITNINNGTYGNSSSWLSNIGAGQQYIGLNFHGTVNIGSIAWGRDNGNTVIDACNGTCMDRALGNYTLQYTNVANPGTGTADTGAAGTGWATLGTVNYTAAAAGFTPYLRHNYNVAQNGSPIAATGFRIIVSDPNIAIDEIEINAPSTTVPDAAFGTELIAVQTIVNPAFVLPKVAINEISSADAVSFGVELANYDSASIDLTGYVLVRSGATESQYVLPAQSLAAGGYLALTQAVTTLDPASGDKLFLFTPGKTKLVDAIVVNSRDRARETIGVGRWLTPSTLTLGAANTFALRDEIVINEVMYHHTPTQAVPAVTQQTNVVPLTNTWKYSDAGVEPAANWQASNYDDSAWTSGAGVLAAETAQLGVAKNMALAPGRNAYYFRSQFQFSGNAANTTLDLNSIIDDGAIFYLNGVEFLRYNMPDGPVTYATQASAVVSDAVLGNHLVIPANLLNTGTNLLAVEVHQAAAPVVTPGSSPAITPAAGYGITWDGTQGDYFNPNNPALTPDNLALASHGTTSFGSSELGFNGLHTIAHVNDGRYGNSNSWIPIGAGNEYIGLKFSGLTNISNVAWGRDNGNTVDDGCGGTCMDRAIGNYTIQITRAINPGVGTTETGDAATGWVTVGSLNYASAGANFLAYQRHGYNVSQNGQPIQATGLRILVSDAGTDIDELEINSPTDLGNADAVFGATISTTTTISPAQPFAESNEQWIELFNRSNHTVDISGWKLDDAVNYTFAANTTLAAGEYLVIAKDPVAMRALYPSPTIRIVGGFSGSLSGSTERIALLDLANNPADEVTYYDGGRWPTAPDGGGSSLELRDPDADNSKAEAWAASDESGKSSWQTYTYTGVVQSDSSTEQWHEFIMGFLDAGEALVDDISVIENPSGAATQLIQNGSFESGTTDKWRILGNHQGSVVVDPTNPANHVLRLVSSGEAEDRLNHAETTFVNNAPIVNGLEYTVSFRAKWISGSPQLNTHFYFNRLPKTTLIATPTLSGTPGAINSHTVANIGPTYSNFQHGPVVPAVQQAVTVSVAAADPDGVTSMVLWWKTDGGVWQQLPMAGTGGNYVASIPGQAAGTIVQFYVEGTDGLGVKSTYPAEGTTSRALYKVQDGQALNGAAHEFRIIMTADDTTLLHTPTNQQSNERMNATVVYDEKEVFYNVGVKLRGSNAGRADDTYLSFSVEFDPDHLFRGVQSTVGLDRSGRGAQVTNGQEEILIKHLVNQAGGVPGMYDDIIHVIAPKAIDTRMALLTYGYNNDLLDSQFDNGSDGSLFKLDLNYVPNGTVDGNPESLKLPTPYSHPQSKELADYGTDKEAYRNHLYIQNNRDADDYSRIIELARAFSLTGAALDAATQPLMDIDEWMRTFAIQSLTGAADTYTRGGLNHNIDFYVRPEDNKVLALPWDWDFAFTNPTNDALIGPASNLNKVMLLPANTRLFYGNLQDLIATVFNTSYMSHWTTNYGAVANQQFGPILTYIQDRATFVTNQLAIVAPKIPFAITTNGGADFSVNTSTVTIAGDGWINVKQIYLEGRPEPLDVTWTDQDSWQVTIPLVNGANTLKFNAVDYQGKLLDALNAPIGTDTIVVNTTAGQPAQDAIRVTELMYHPGNRSQAEINAGFTNDDDFEFIELQNTGANTVNLTGLTIANGITFDFTNGTVPSLGAGEYVLVVKNLAAFSTRYNTAGLKIAGEFSGQLSNSGEGIDLFNSLTLPIQQFSYLDSWYPSTDGPGQSLVIINPLAPTPSWNDAVSWRPSTNNGGSPGLTDPTVSVAGRKIFYNNSAFDGRDTAANAADDAAIATNKSVLLPGGSATGANYTNYSRGINGLMIDIAGRAHNPLTAADFIFRVGNATDVSTWTTLNAALAPTIAVRVGAGAGGSDRISLVFADGAVKNTWLQVTVKANAQTGLGAPDVFYVGNAIGESGTGADAAVTATDEIDARNNLRSFINPAPITFAFDYNRDGFVNAADQIIARGSITAPGSQLNLGINTTGLLLSPPPADGSLTGQALSASANSGSASSDLSLAIGLAAGSSASATSAPSRQLEAVYSEASAGSFGDNADLASPLLFGANASARSLVDADHAGSPHDLDDDLLDLLARGGKI